MPEQPPPTFDWMDVDVERVKAVPGEDGLTLERINIGRYGVVPDHWPYVDDTPRGAAPGGPITFAASYSLNDKVEVWSENAAALYEDGIRDRWASAAVVPWGELRPLPYEQERAMGQICTRLSEQGFASQQILGKWLEKIAYGFLEVKSFLATQLFDYGRQCEVFRKRALANKGGLGIESPGIWNRSLGDSLKWTEFVVAMDLLQGTATVTMLEALEEHAPTDCERTIYQLVARDSRRHVEYGVGHVAYHLEHAPERRPQVNIGLFRAEAAWCGDLAADRPFAEALAILLGADDGFDAGWERLEALQERQLEAYLVALERAGLGEHRNAVYPLLRRPTAALAPSAR